MASLIDISQFTNGSVTTNVDNQYEWSGTAVFDVIMKAVNGNIKVEYDNGRITTTDYSTVYLGALQTAIQEAMQFILQKEIAEKQVASTAEQTLLYARQRQGFDDNKNQKLLETQMNSWGLMFSSGLLTQKPAIIESDEVSILYNVLKPQTVTP